MTSPVDLPSAVRQAVLYQIGNIHTALPAAIVAYDFTKQKASVQPLLNKVWADGTSTPMPVIQNVPVIFPRAGGASLSFPVLEGDTCLLLFIERSTDLWKTVGGQVNPDDNRKYDLTDAVAIMGLFPFSDNSLAPNNTDVTLSYEGSNIIINEDGDILIETSNKVAIGNSTVELLDTLITLFTSVAGAANFATAQPFFANAATALSTIKGIIPP